MFLPYVSSPELEGCIVTWDFFETIHSRSYTHIIKNVYPDPAEVFDTILNDEEILKRAKSVTKNYDVFGTAAEDYFVKGKGDILDVKGKLYLAMINVNLLEGLRFYVSFACTFAFGFRDCETTGGNKICWVGSIAEQTKCCCVGSKIGCGFLVKTCYQPMSNNVNVTIILTRDTAE